MPLPALVALPTQQPHLNQLGKRARVLPLWSLLGMVSVERVEKRKEVRNQGSLFSRLRILGLEFLYLNGPTFTIYAILEHYPV